MPTEFKIPELGENVSAGDVVRILVKAGDTLQKDQPVLELETDKATIEVPSNVSGTVGEVKVKTGDKVKVGQVVLTLSDGAGGAAEKAAPAAEKTDKPADEKRGGAKAAAKAEKGAAPGDKDDKDDKDDKADKGASKPKPQPLGAPEEGGLSQAVVPGRTGEDEAAAAERPQKPRGEVVDINRGARAAQPPQPAEPDASAAPAAPAAPSVRRLARELGVDIAAGLGQRSPGPHQHRRRAGVRALGHG